jgi:hypothetical protein
MPRSKSPQRYRTVMSHGGPRKSLRVGLRVQGPGVMPGGEADEVGSRTWN